MDEGTGAPAPATTTADPAAALMAPIEGGASTNPFTSKPDAKGQTNEFYDNLPEEYQSKEYLKGVDSIESVLKMLDGAQSVIGKKTIGVPTAESTPEEWKAHYAKLGMPETADGYAFSETVLPEGVVLPEGFDLDDKDSMEFMTEAFLEANLTNKQADILTQKHRIRLAESLSENAAARAAEKENINKQFNELALKTFGDKTKDVLSDVNGMLAKYSDPAFKAHLEGLDNNSLIAMASTLSNFKKAHLGEDSQVGGAPAAQAVSGDDLRQKARELRNLPEYKDGSHSMHRRVNDRITELYAAASKKDNGRK